MKKGTTVMLQGTASDAGKSVLCTALCRIFREDGYKTAPFKSQNMALNSYVTSDGGEIGRAQGVQAEACGIEATVDMNPVLLKPKQGMGTEVIVRGKHFADVHAESYNADYVDRLLPVVRESLERLNFSYDIVVMEGAGSPAEINLRDRDIANMRAAALADAPVILVTDIDRGGAFASLIGTLALLEEDERSRVKGFIINKFRGSLSLLQPGLDWLEEKTGIPVLGVIPYFDIHIEAEDSLALASLRLKKQDDSPKSLRVTVIRFPLISNFTDLDPLYDEPGVSIRLISSAEEWQQPDIIILPGTKNTMEDLRWLHRTGLAKLITEAAQQGAYVAGVCGGYQMLGNRLEDRQGVESDGGLLQGLALLPSQTEFAPGKRTTRSAGVVMSSFFATGQPVEGYEIHFGRTDREKGALPLIDMKDGGEDGMITDDGRVWGTYLHGIFHNREFTRSWLNFVRQEKGLTLVAERTAGEAEQREAAYASLAALVRKHLDVNRLYEIMGVRQ